MHPDDPGAPTPSVEFVVPEADSGMRLDVWLVKQYPAMTRSKAQRLLRSGAVEIDGRTADVREPVVPGARVRLSRDALAAAEPKGLVPTAMDLEILFEDDHIIVVNKPAGLSVHPGAGTRVPTLIEGLLARGSWRGTARSDDDESGADSNGTPAALRPGMVHRLDKDTSGVLVCARHDAAHAALARQFQDKSQLLREYLALLDGVMVTREVEHESWLARDSGDRTRFDSITATVYQRLVGERPSAAKKWRHAKSLFQRERVYGNRLTLARVRLFTGRTHQIRLHARDLNLGVVGDPVYHRPAILPTSFPEGVRRVVKSIKRQQLHAWRLGFVHPETHERMLFEVPPPEDFRHILALLEPFGGEGNLPKGLKGLEVD